MAGKQKANEMEGIQNPLKVNHENHDYPEGTSTNNVFVERDFLQQFVVNTCLPADYEMTNCDAKLAHSEDKEKGMLQNTRISLDLHMGATSPNLDKHNMEHTGNLDLNSVFEVAESGDHVDANHALKIIKRHNSREQDKEYGKKKRKVLEPNKDGVGSSLNNSEIMLEKEVVAGHENSLEVLEDILVDKHVGSSSNVEHASGESHISAEAENFDQAKRTLFSANQAKQLDSSGSDPPSFVLDQKEQSKIGDSIPSSSNLDTPVGNPTEVKDNCSEAEAPIACLRKKLLVLDVNGLLADIVSDLPDGFEPDTLIGRKAVFKRPFCDDFLQFCFERFNVGVWSSRTKRNVESVLDFIMEKTWKNLLFCWDQSHCTETGFNTVENRDKPLLLKELKKLWEKHEANLPWEKGEYNESNTLLLDDSPYKALRNPPNTAIFPHTYHFRDKKDTSLGPGGDLRVYLEGLSLAENVQKYVEQNPYGQRPITKSNLSWHFYLKVIGTTSTQHEDNSKKSNLDHPSVENKIKIELKKSKESNGEDCAAKHGASSKDLVGENFEKDKRAVVHTNQNVVSDVYSAGRNNGEFTTKPLEQRRVSNMEESISSSSELVALYGSVQVISKENHHQPPLFRSSSGRALPESSKRKLIILDLNAILVDIVPQYCDGNDGHKADTVIMRKAVYKRPFCEDFLQFCFERFSVGVWSSGPKLQVQLLVDYLMPKNRHNLLFAWDFSHCTCTGFTTVEHRDRPLLLKELRKLWEKHDPHLPWQRGEYNESNTLLLDIAPHKALRNPQNTAIFPNPYRYTLESDTSLGPGGDLRMYLEGLASAENVQKYIEQNRFGQRPITRKNLSWQFYLKVIGYDPYGDANNSFAGSSGREDHAPNYSAA